MGAETSAFIWKQLSENFNAVPRRARHNEWQNTRLAENVLRVKHAR